MGDDKQRPITVELSQHQLSAIEHAWRRINPSDPEYEVIADLLRQTGRLNMEQELARSAEALINQVSRLLHETERNKPRCVWGGGICNREVPAEGAVCDTHNRHPPNSLNWHRRKLGLPPLKEASHTGDAQAAPESSNASQAYDPTAPKTHHKSPPLESKCKWDEGCDRNATHGRYCEEHVKAYRVEDSK